MKSTPLTRPQVNHYLIEVFNVPSQKILHVRSLRHQIALLVKKLKLKALKSLFYDFKPFGATFLLVLSGSHLAIHTWPENNYIHIDLFLCRSAVPKRNIAPIIKRVFGAKKLVLREIDY